MLARSQLLDESQLEQLAQHLGKLVKAPMVIYFDGDLGAGKTTFCRALIRQRGHQGPVKSPTYTLVEPYFGPDLQLYHFDLYRLVEAQELEYLGIDDYFGDQSIALIEWPSRGVGYLPAADLHINLQIEQLPLPIILS